MEDHIGEYGYFYVKDNHITAVHLIGTTASSAELGFCRQNGWHRYHTSPRDIIIRVRNVSQWQEGKWKDTGRILQHEY